MLQIIFIYLHLNTINGYERRFMQNITDSNLQFCPE